MMLNKFFGKFASWTARAAGKPGATILAAALVLVWAVTGPAFHYSNDWQLVINTGTTIITFLMVFIIQHTQNCDSYALHIKLDELIRSGTRADNRLIDLEHLDSDELVKLRQAYNRLAEQHGAASYGAPSCPSPADPQSRSR